MHRAVCAVLALLMLVAACGPRPRPVPSITPTVPTSPSSSTPVTSTTTLPPTTATTTATPPSESCELPNFPTPACTGVPSGTVLAQLGEVDYHTQAPGEEITARRINALYVDHPGVVIRDSQIDTAVWVRDGGSLLIERSTIGPECGGEKWLSGGIVGANYTAKAVHIRGHEDGFKASGSGVVVRDSYVDICGHGDGHSDGIQDHPSTTGLVFEHNTIDLRGEVGQNAAVNINAGDKDGQVCVSTNVRIVHNLLMGGGYTLTLCPAGDGWEVVGNRIVDRSWGGQEKPDDYRAWNISHDGCTLMVWDDNDTVAIDSEYRVVATVEDDRPCK